MTVTIATTIKWLDVVVGFFSVSKHVQIHLNIKVTPNVTPEMKIVE